MNAQSKGITVPVLNSIPEACQKAHIGRSTLYSLIKKGAIKVTKIGSKTLITDDEIARLIAAGTTA